MECVYLFDDDGSQVSNSMERIWNMAYLKYSNRTFMKDN